MSRPSRRNEVNRKRARRERLRKLREHFAKAKTAGEKEKILQKVSRVAPCISPEEFVAPLQAA